MFTEMKNYFITINKTMTIKNVIYSIIIFSNLMFGCSKSNLDNLNSNDKIKSIRERAYLATDENGIISVGDQIDPSIGRHNYFDLFNEDGLLVKSILFDGNENINRSTTFEYDSNNNITKETYFNSTGEFTGMREYYYEDDLIKQKCLTTTNSNASSCITYNYNNDNILVEERSYSSGYLSYISEVKIIKNGLILITEKTISYVEDDQQIVFVKTIEEEGKKIYDEITIDTGVDFGSTIIEYQYDNLGNIIEREITSTGNYQEDRTTKYIYTYEEYDGNNNWITMYIHFNTELWIIIKREIEYY